MHAVLTFKIDRIVCNPRKIVQKRRHSVRHRVRFVKENGIYIDIPTRATFIRASRLCMQRPKQRAFLSQQKGKKYFFTAKSLQ